MPDVPVIYLATTEGEEGFKLFKATDPRLVRRHIIDSMPVPKVEVRRPTTEEAMEAALDGIAIIDITKKDAPTEPDLLTNTEGNAEPNGADATATTGGSAPLSDQNTSSEDEGSDLPVGADAPRLVAPGEYVDNDGEVHSDDAVLERQEPVVDDDPFGRVDA